MAEALMVLLITSLILVATMPVITKRNRKLAVYQHGPVGGWVCKKEQMPCKFVPPAKAKHFLFYFDDEITPSFSAINVGTLTFVKKDTINSTQTENTGYTGITNDDEETEYRIYEENPYLVDDEREYIDSGRVDITEHTVQTVSCENNVPELYKSMDIYKQENLKLSGTFCSGANMIRIVY